MAPLTVLIDLADSGNHLNITVRHIACVVARGHMTADLGNVATGSQHHVVTRLDRTAEHFVGGGLLIGTGRGLTRKHTHTVAVDVHADTNLFTGLA